MMRMNSEKNNYGNSDVYSDLNASYSATYLASDAQEFSLQSVQEKLGSFSQVEETSTGALNADTMPTQQTLTMNYQREYQQGNVAVASKLNTKAKVAIVSYVAVVLALVLGVVFASVAVNGAFSANVELTQSYQGALENISALETELSVEDAKMLAERAAELGYVNANESNTQTYTKVETRPAQNFNIETNWFDSLCDWLSGAFGG